MCIEFMVNIFSVCVHVNVRVGIKWAARTHKGGPGTCSSRNFECTRSDLRTFSDKFEQHTVNAEILACIKFGSFGYTSSHKNIGGFKFGGHSLAPFNAYTK